MNFFIPTATWTRILGCVLLVGSLAGCSAKQLFNEGMLDIKAGRYDVGLAKIEDAVRKDPDSAFLRTELRIKRNFVIQTLLQNAEANRAASRFTEARELYNHALDLDRDNAGAKKGLELTRIAEMSQEEIRMAKELIGHHNFKEAQAQLAHILGVDPNNQEAKQMLEQLTGKIAQSAPAKPKLRLKEDRIASLDFRETPLNMVFQALSRTTGLNFVLDKDVKGDVKTSIFLKDMPVESALNLVLAQHTLEKKIMSDNTIFIYPETTEKRRRFEEQVVKSFYLTNTDPKQAMNLLKVMLDTKVLFVDDRARLLVMRDTPEVIRMAEKLIASIDQEDSEVMMEVEVVEIQRSKLQELGIKYPNQVTLSALAPAAAGAATGGTATSVGMLLGDVLTLNTNRVRTSALGATIDLRGEAGQVNLLASPRIRAKNYEKAKILIGDRVPVITNAVTPTANAAVVTGSVQYIEVGLKFEVEPTIYQDDEVAMKVNLEVSNIVKEVPNTSSGTLAYQIGTRTVSTVLRLRDGETQVLGGLISEEDRETSSKIPGLGNLPILGRLFQSQRDATTKTEIVLSITPHIIRHGERPSASSSQFSYGTESTRGVSTMLKTGEDIDALPLVPKEVTRATGLLPITPPLGTGSSIGPTVPADPAASLPAAAAAGAKSTGSQTPNSSSAAPAPSANPENVGAAPQKEAPATNVLPPAALETGSSADREAAGAQPLRKSGRRATRSTSAGDATSSPSADGPLPAVSTENTGTAPQKGTPSTDVPPATTSTPIAPLPADAAIGSKPAGGQPSSPSLSEPASAGNQENEGNAP
jgi:general secretion pathway protein D